MSIARGAAMLARSFRTLMFPAAVRLLPIKDLKALSVFSVGVFYRHAGPKGPEEICPPLSCVCLFPERALFVIWRRDSSGQVTREIPWDEGFRLSEREPERVVFLGIPR